jgi:hypothetical protein
MGKKDEIFKNSEILLAFQSPVVTICTTSLIFTNSTFCPHSVFMCFVRISEKKQLLFPYTKLTGFYNRDSVCLLRGTDWVFKYNTGLQLFFNSWTLH